MSCKTDFYKCIIMHFPEKYNPNILMQKKPKIYLLVFFLLTTHLNNGLRVSWLYNEIVIKYSENLSDDNKHVDQKSITNGGSHKDQYIMEGNPDGEKWKQSFP